jgi:hypothetical protein
MKLQNAAGLVLVAWYLMLPPPASLGERLTYEPLSEWKLIDEFESESVCRKMRAKLIKQMSRTAIDIARCVPADDPALAPDLGPKVISDRAGN